MLQLLHAPLYIRRKVFFYNKSVSKYLMKRKNPLDNYYHHADVRTDESFDESVSDSDFGAPESDVMRAFLLGCVISGLLVQS